MKKIIAILFAVVLCLSLAACGGYDEDTVIGTWTGTYNYASDTTSHNGVALNQGDIMVMTMDVFKGGTVEVLRVDSVTGAEIKSSGTWTFDDDVLVISYGSVNAGFEVVSEEELAYQGTNVAFAKTMTKSK